MLLVGPTRTEMPQTEQRFKQPTEHVSVSQVRRLCPHFTPLNPPPSFSLLSATIQYLSRLPPQLSPLPLSSSPSLIPSTSSVPVVLVWSERAATTAEQAGAIHYHTATISLQRARDTDTYRERERERAAECDRGQPAIISYLQINNPYITVQLMATSV